MEAGRFSEPRYDQISVPTMPMKEEIAPRITGSLMHHNQTGRQHPTLLLATEIVHGIFGSRPISCGMDKSVELNAEDCIPDAALVHIIKRSFVLSVFSHAFRGLGTSKRGNSVVRNGDINGTD